MIKSVKKSDRSRKNVTVKKDCNYFKNLIKSDDNASKLSILNIFYFRNIIILLLCLCIAVLYNNIIAINKKLKQIDTLSDKLSSIQDKEGKSIDVFFDKIDSFDKKYHEEILLLHDKLNIVNNKQKLRVGPYLVALTAINHLRLRIDAGEDFKHELEILKMLDLSDKNINKFISFISSRTKGIKTLNRLQIDYNNLVMDAIFNQKNFASFTMSCPKFFQKLFYSIYGLIKIRRIDSTDDQTVDSILQKISISLNNGNLKDVISYLEEVKTKYTDAFKVLKSFYDEVYEKYKIESELSNIITTLLKNIYDLQLNATN